MMGILFLGMDAHQIALPRLVSAATIRSSTPQIPTLHVSTLLLLVLAWSGSESSRATTP